jgi:putative selenium metabolism protein SsnA
MLQYFVTEGRKIMIITNANIITCEDPNRIIENGSILIQGDTILDIKDEPVTKIDYPQEEVVDAGGQYVMPGSICAHTHFYGAYSRGMSIPGKPAADFPEILDKLWWKLDKALDHEAVYYSALVSMLDAIRHGTTTLIDHHASPNAIDGSLDDIAQAALESGLRISTCYEVTDRDGKGKAKAGIDENIRFIKRYQAGELPERIFPTFGLHASLTLNDDTLEHCAASIPQGFGVHIHVAEHQVDEFDSLYRSGKRIIERLDSFHILNSHVLIVHAVHIDAKEMQIIKEQEAWVSHQPRSNMNNAVGLPQVESMLHMGIPVCLGNDGFSNTMWDEWKAAYFAHKLIHRDPRRMGADSIARMAWTNNANLVKKLSGSEVGILRKGAKADLIFVDYKPYTPLTAGNLPWQLIFGFQNSMITATVVDGKFLMRDGKILVLDEEKIIHDALRLAPVVWERYSQYFA